MNKQKKKKKKQDNTCIGPKIDPTPNAGGGSATRRQGSTSLKETGRWKNRRRIRDLFADRRCSQAVLDFLPMTDVGRMVPAVEEEANTESELSEGELRERQEREEERRGGGGGAGY